MSHFAQRMAERYPEVQDPEAFRAAVAHAIKTERWDMIDHVFDMPQATIYRAKDVSGAIVYVVAKGNDVVTAIRPSHCQEVSPDPGKQTDARRWSQGGEGKRMSDGEFMVGDKFLSWDDMTDSEKLAMFRHQQSQAARFMEERNFLRTLLLAQAGRTGEEIDNLKFGW